MAEAALLFAIVFALGAIPTFIPSTAVVAAFSLRDAVGPFEAVAVAVPAIVLGRIVLALVVRSGFRHLRQGAISENVDWLRGWIAGRRRAPLLLTCICAIPLMPTTQIFVAAGALRLRLSPLALGYTVNRTIVYGAAVIVTSASEAGVESLLRRGVNPWLLAAAFVAVAIPLFLLTRVEWRALIQERRLRFIGRRRDPKPSPGTGGTDM